MKKTKKFYKSKKDKVLAGLIGGLADYSGVDATILRLLWVLIVITTGIVPGLIVYFIAILITPEK